MYVYIYCIYIFFSLNTVTLQKCNVKQSISKVLILVGIILKYVISHQFAMCFSNDSFWGHTPSRINQIEFSISVKKTTKNNKNHSEKLQVHVIFPNFTLK